MVWQDFCSCGLKTKVFVTSLTMTSDLYMKECLEKRFLPFICQHKGPRKFWHGLASCNWSKATQKWYCDNNIDLIKKLSTRLTVRNYVLLSCTGQLSRKNCSTMMDECKQSKKSVRNVKLYKKSQRNYCAEADELHQGKNA
jgi:hypothetical protein